MDKQARLKKSIITVTKTKQKFSRRGLILISLLILVILIAVLGSLANFYSKIETAYHNYIYEDFMDSRDEKHDRTIIFLSLYSSLHDNQGVESNQVIWGQLWQINRDRKLARRLLIPMNLQINDGNDHPKLNQIYAEDSLGLTNYFQDHFNLEIDYLAFHRSDYMKQLAEFIEPLIVNQQVYSISSAQQDSLSGLQIYQTYRELEINQNLESYYVQEAMIDTLYQNIFKTEQILKLPEIMEVGQLFIDTNLPLNLWIEWRLNSYEIENYRLEDSISLDYNQEVKTYQIAFEDFKGLISDFQSLSN